MKTTILEQIDSMELSNLELEYHAKHFYDFMEAIQAYPSIVWDNTQHPKNILREAIKTIPMKTMKDMCMNILATHALTQGILRNPMTKEVQLVMGIQFNPNTGDGPIYSIEWAINTDTVFLIRASLDEDGHGETTAHIHLPPDIAPYGILMITFLKELQSGIDNIKNLLS
jgi:hypothetical protein